MMLQWKRSEDGYTETKCGHYEIEPRHNHSTRPQWFVLYYRPTPDSKREELHYFNDTQRDAKASAQFHADSANLG